MTAVRLAPLPLDHLVAEVAAFPLASMAAFRIGVTHLDASMAKVGHATGRLWREAEAHIAGSFPAFSLDEMFAVRDDLWFDGVAAGAVPLGHYLRRLTASFLRVEGATAIPALPLVRGVRPSSSATESPEATARRAWRWMSFSLPPDLLLGASVGANVEPPRRVELVSPIVDRILRQGGFAETHLHIGAAMDFSAAWLGALETLRLTDTRPGSFESPMAAFDEGRDLGRWVLEAAIARYVLSDFLRDPDRGPLDAFLTETFMPAFATASPGGPAAAATLRVSLDELATGAALDARVAYDDLASVYRALVGARPFEPESLRDLERLDPISRHFPDATAIEARFVARGLGHLDRAPNDSSFARLFWQVIRIRNLFYRHMTQRPMTPGLLWFLRSFSRLSPAKRTIKKLLLESAARTSGAPHGLRGLEVRMSPDADNGRLLDGLKDLDDAGSELRRSGVEVGVVFHFVKERDDSLWSGLPGPHGAGSNGDPAASSWRYRFAAYFEKKMREAMALAWLYENHPIALEIVRGIDMCTDEVGVPTWVMVPVFAHVRAAAASARGQLQFRHDLDVPALRTTVHAGEDFVHLLSGLRRVDEAIRHLDLHEGDRIGHGMALGVHARKWAERTGRLLITREERLLDLVWEWTWYAREGSSHTAERATLLTAEIGRLAAALFDDDVQRSPLDLERLVGDLHDPAALEAVGFPRGLPGAARPEDRLPRRLRDLSTYLTSAALFRRGRELEWVEVWREGEVLEALQRDVRRKVSARSIAIEVNPTSNLLIGNLANLEEHPLWRLRPPRPSPDDPPALTVCIGSDDPITFATDLRQEYQLVHDALLLSGLGDAATRAWIERAREASLETRFTIPRTERLSLGWPRGALR